MSAVAIPKPASRSLTLDDVTIQAAAGPMDG